MDTVEMKQLRFGYFPKVFAVNGTEYTVNEVLKCWTDTRQGCLWFQVRCENQTIEMYRDVKANTWTVENGMRDGHRND